MNTNSTGAYPTLQRHRRRSDQFSPSSPSYPRRLLDRPNRHSDAFSPASSTPPTDESDSPLNLNLAFASPLSDHIAPLSSVSPFTKSPPVESKHRQRSSEEDGRSRYRSSDEVTRPATSSPIDQNNTIRTSLSRSPLPGADYGSRLSPPLSYSSQQLPRERKVLEPPIKFGDNASSPNLRNYSFSTQMSDKSAHEEPLPTKAQAGKKSRLNLLMNPMSLWARRRSSQNPAPEDVNVSIKPLSVPALPDDFDPSIRGKVVHDFSAPRTRKLYSHNDISSLESPIRSGYGPDNNRANRSPGSSRLPLSGTPNMLHSPMFKEHFQDDRPSLQPERTGYLHNIHAFNTAYGQQDPGDVPAFARLLPSAVPQISRDTDPELSRKKNKPLPPGKENMPSPALEEPSPPPPTPPPKGTPSPKFDIPAPAALPKHMTSTSSRFSFQIGGSGSSAQEKLLEEKHKQHEATRKTTTQGGGEDEDDFDYDFDADDGLEEPIPGVNADFDEDDDFGNDDIPMGNALLARYGPTEIQETPLSDVKTTTLQRHSLQGFHFTPQSMTFSPTSTNNASQPTPRDHEGFAIGIADSRAPSQDEILDFHSQDGVIDVEKVSMLGGLGISTAEVHGRRTQQTSRPQGRVFDDDLYFDDGEFGDFDIDPSGVIFDERLFDDDTGEIRDIPADNARKFEAAKQAAGADNGVMVINPWGDAAGNPALNENSQQDETEQISGASMNGQAKTHASLPQGGSVAGLTETNLAAYHDALAYAANQAAANGRFDRKVSFSQNSDGTSQSPFESNQPGIVSDDSHFSYNYSSAIAEDDGFPFDDDMDDDLMIAEANAEALENDDDGFYGQEFGFYARSRGKDNTESTNGGYFAERGSNGVKRSHSGKANFQEPSLTPITERSEFSTRNSVISLQIPGGLPTSAQSMSSPGIAQLRELDSPAYDEDMNFSALRKLRGRTFGGSSSSLNSSVAGFPSSSPRVHVANNPFSDLEHGASRMSVSIHGRSPSAGIPESEEEDEDSERPTLTQNTPRKKVSETLVTSQEEMPSPPESAGGERRKGHHSRTSSGADSVVSYVMHEGGWVMERRRTDEGSGAEVVDREYLDGARI